MSALRVLVCGSREWDDYQAVARFLAFLEPNDVVIHGAARGADMLADQVANRRRCRVEAYPADWEQHGKRAGYLRNAEMLEKGRPDLVVGFGHGKGTDMMLDLAAKAGVKTYRVERPAEASSAGDA